MASLKQRLIDIVERIGDEFSTLRATLGQNSNLNTINKTNLVAAINEINNKNINTLEIQVNSPSATWILSHTLGRNPIVDVYLTNGEKILADVVTTNNQIIVIHSQPTTGFVVLY